MNKRRRITMSDISLHASIYEQLSGYADRLDRALAKLSSTDPAAAAASRSELVSVLLELNAESVDKPMPHVISLILRSDATLAQHANDLMRIARAVEARNETRTDLMLLETVASLIDRECMRSGSRMRGRV
jgi:hypothetical protein